ncbi:MAG TPA: mechanosensitive ion channel [Gammaproteobacteria bacterium]|nr:mechanosensitive ion channel [Gammaproteobacteria bacterium]
MESISIDKLSDPTLIEKLLIPWAIKLAVALAIFIVGRWIAKWLTGVVRKLMKRANVDDMLTNFIANIVYTVLLLVVIMATLDHLGIKTTSLLAVFGAAGLAIGLALKDSLANFSSGVMLIMFRPFQVGDFIEAAGVAGVVEEVRMFATLLRTGDNRQIIVPNGQIYGGTIINYSAKDTRRIDMVFGIGYGDDIRKAKQIIEEIMQQDDRILEDPAPAVALAELADSSVNFNVRPWVKSGDYWPVRSDLLEKIKLAFDAEGISIPYPQQEVYMHQVA